MCPASVLLVLARSFEGFGRSVVELLEFKRGEVVDRARAALGVEPPHPAGGRGLDLVDVSPGSVVVDPFGLVEPDLRFGGGVIVSPPDVSAGWVDFLVDEPVGERNRRIDASAQVTAFASERNITRSMGYTGAC